LGPRYIVAPSWDKAGEIHKTGVHVTVQAQAGTIRSPMPDATVTSPVPVVATADGVSPVQTMQIYVDGTLTYKGDGNALNTTQQLTPGKHSIVVEATDQSGAVTRSRSTVNVVTP